MAFKMRGTPMYRNFGIGGSGMGQKSAEEARIASLTESEPLPEGTGKKSIKESKEIEESNPAKEVSPSEPKVHPLGVVKWEKDDPNMPQNLDPPTTGTTGIPGE